MLGALYPHLPSHLPLLALRRLSLGLSQSFPDACPGLLHPCVQVAVSNSANLNYIIRQLDVFTSSHWLREGPALGLARELP